MKNPSEKHRAGSTPRWIGIFAMALTACAFVASATELTFGDPDIPSITQQAVISLTDVNAALSANLPPIEVDPAIPEDQLPSTDLPPDATWQALVEMICTLDPPALAMSVTGEEDGENNTLEITLEALADGSGASCEARDLQMTATLLFVPLTEQNQEDIKAELNTDLAELKDAILQVRFRFSRLSFGQQQADETWLASEALTAGLKLILRDPDIDDREETPFVDGELDLVPTFLLDSITEASPQRFELDPDSPVTDAIKNAIVTTSGERSLELEASLRIPRDLRDTLTLDGSGVAIAFQPEVTISVLDALDDL